MDADDLTQKEILELRKAASQAWSDGSRHERFQLHPMKELGQCYVTSAWLKNRLGGYIGLKNGHYFWISPDKTKALDLVNDHIAYQPIEPNHEGLKADDQDLDGYRVPEARKQWHPGPPIYKATTHHLFKDFRVKDIKQETQRTKDFIQKANQAYDAS